MTREQTDREIPSRYKGMWLFALFDLPVDDKKARKEYTLFRKHLVKQGFSMLQFSVYAKFCLSRENSRTYQGRINKILPSGGQVRLLSVTDKQFADMIVFFGKVRQKPEKAPEQILLF